jgi:NTE family protein
MIQKYPFKNLVFQGGGVKSFAYHGALRVLDEKKILQQIERVAGTSAGALVALLLSFRLDIEDTIELIKKIDYSKIPVVKKTSDPETPSPGVNIISRELDRLQGGMDAVNRLFRSYGWYASVNLSQILEDLIGSYCQGNSRATFADFESYGFRELHVIATNISKHQVADFSARTTPDVAVADALLMSASYPLYFEALRFDGSDFGQGDYYVDGGILNNYPLHIFDGPAFAEESRHYMHGVNWETLGCRLFTPRECPDLSRPITGLISYLDHLFDAIVEAQAIPFENSLIDQLRSISISNCCVGTTDVNIKPETSDPKYIELVNAGEAAAREYLEKYKLPTDKLYDLKARFADFLAGLT